MSSSLKTKVIHMDIFESGKFSIPGPDGLPVQCEVLFTYDWELTGRSYVVFTMGEEHQMCACRVVETEDGNKGLAPLENEQERDLLNHCYEELQRKLREGEPVS